MRQLKRINFFWIIILVSLVVLSILYTYISADAPYYLSIARDINNGLIPYEDIRSIYTPLMMYLNSLLLKVFNDPGYKLFLGFQYLIFLISSFFLYKISRELELGKHLSLFLCLFYSISILSSDGTYINLEAYILLCVLTAFYLFLKKKLFCSGFVLALSVFFKQYGILSFLPFILLVFYSDQENPKRGVIQFVSGSIVPAIVFFGYYTGIVGVSVENLFTQLSGEGYGEKGVSSAISIFSLLAGAKVFLLLLLPLVFMIKRLNKINVILLLGVVVNLIPVLIQNFDHYFLLTFPYLFFLMAYNIKEFNKRWFFTANISLVIISLLLFLRIFRYKDVHVIQVEIAEKVADQYPKGSEIFLIGEIRYLYIINNYQNPVLEEIGYDYSFCPEDKFKKKYEVLSTDVINQ